MQQHLISQNYPGLLDGITPSISYPDIATVTSNVVDCALLTHVFETATGNPRLNAVIIEADEQTGHATDIERLSYSADELKDLSDVGSVRSSV